MADELDDEERALFAALVAPGVACAYVEAEVTGFEANEWVPTTLPDALAAALRRNQVRVQGFDG